MYEEDNLQLALKTFEASLDALGGDKPWKLEITPKTYQPGPKELPVNIAPIFPRFETGAQVTRVELAFAAAIGAANIYVLQRQYQQAKEYFAWAEGCGVGAEVLALDRAWMAIKQRNWADARAQRLHALQVSKDDAQRASAVLSQAMIERYAGEALLAFKLFTEAAALFRAHDEEPRAVFADTQRATMYLEHGQPAEAAALLETLKSKDPVIAGQISLGLARAKKQAGKQEEALADYLRFFDQIIGYASSLMTDEGRSSALAEQKALFDEVVELAFEVGAKTGDFRAARNIAERARDRGLRDLSVESDTLEPTEAGVLLKPNEGDIREDPRTIVMQAAPTLRAHHQTRRAYEAEGEDTSNIPTTLEYYLLSSRTLIFLRRPNGETRGAAVKISPEELELQVENYRNSLGLEADARGGTVLIEPAPNEEAKLASLLYSELIGPIERSLPEKNEAMVIVPDGALWRLPFAAIGGTDRLLARHPLSYAISASGLAATARRERKREGRALLFGNPDTRSTRGCANENMEWRALPGAEREVAAIAKLFGDRAVLRTGGETSPLLLEAWHRELSVLHFATHGYACAGAPLESFLVLSDFDPRAWTLENGRLEERAHRGELAIRLDDEEQKRFFAGKWPSYTAHRDKLEARQIFSNYRLNSDLVMLSACDTGLGVLSSEGALGFARAFIASGARTVGLSLWPVPDQPTGYLMEQFYTAYLAHGNKARALQTAMLATRAKYPRTVAWAAFVLLGAQE